MATVDHVADAEGMFSEINSASDSFIFRLEQCFALYPDFLTNVEIEAKVIAALQKAESYIVHPTEKGRTFCMDMHHIVSSKCTIKCCEKR